MHFVYHYTSSITDLQVEIAKRPCIANPQRYREIFIASFFMKQSSWRLSASVVSLTSAFKTLFDSHTLPVSFAARKCLPLIAFFTCLYASAQIFSPGDFPMIRTPRNVSVNYSLPKNALKPDEPLIAKFSKDPTDEEISRLHFFEMPLIPLKGEKHSNENMDLVFALAKFSQRSILDDFSAITEFIDRHPDTRWKLSLLTNLGSMYRRSGWLLKAITTWEEAWRLGKSLTDFRLRNITDETVSGLSLLYSRLGQYEQLDSLLEQIKERKIHGSAAQVLLNIKEGLDVMRRTTGIDFRCAPVALNAIQQYRSSKIITYDDFARYKSSQEKKGDSLKTGMHDHCGMNMSCHMGTTLTQLKEMSDIVKMNMQMAKRVSPSAEIIIPAVIHWKTGHFSALIKKEKGLYLIQDPTLGLDMWVSKKVLDEEFSGYSLIPAGGLPAGWRIADRKEAEITLGINCAPTGSNPDGTTCHDEKSGGSGSKGVQNGTRMATYSFHTMLVSLRIQDNPVGYAPPKGPGVEFSVVYNQREANQPAVFNYSNLGTKWTFNWLSYISDDPGNPAAPVKLFTPSGGAFVFTNYNAGTNSYAPEQMTQDILVRIQDGCYELRHNDGSKDSYSRPVSWLYGQKIFLTKVTDAAGNSVTISYDNDARIIALQDALGQVTHINYDNHDDNYKITSVTDPFGRSAKFQYDDNGRLISITDVIGIISSFRYDEDDFINEMTTPYGTTTFEYGEIPTVNNIHGYRFLQATDPLGQKERLEMYLVKDSVSDTDPLTPVVPNESFYNGRLNWQNSYFWDKQAMNEYPRNFSKAHLYHWLGDNSYQTTSRILHSEKTPLENRVWYLYKGQAAGSQTNPGMFLAPRLIAQVVDTIASISTTQAYKFEYNTIGKRTKSTDPSGRQFTYKYDSTNNIDLLEVRQTTNGANELLAKLSDYNSQHLPKKTTDASGQTTSYVYNATGQLQTITNPKQEKTTFTYDGKGYLKSIKGPVAGAKVNFAYDGFGRIDTVTDSEGYKVATDYDNLDRPTLVTYPDKTYEQIVYNKLDPAHMKDRLGKWSHITHDKLRNPAFVQDALGRVSQFIWRYGLMEEIVDPLKQVTTFTHDIQGRVVTKIYDDNKSIIYKYDSAAGRLSGITDSKGQTTKYTYYLDGNLKQVEYINAAVATPSVSYSYDDKYNRLDTMIDGTGTTTYTYKAITGIKTTGSGMLQKIDGPFSKDIISYAYDELGRIKSRSINGVASSVIYDSLGRVTSATNALGTFGYNYVSTSNRLSSITNPNNTGTVFTYFDNVSDQRLKEIWNKSDSTTLSRFNYEYNDEGQITKWIQQAGTVTPTYYDLGYDLADQLIFATQRNQNTNAVIKRYAYQYDKAGNRINEQTDNNVTSATFNKLNQITAQQDGGSMHFKGTVNEFSSVLVKNQTSADSAFAQIDSLTNSFDAFVKIVPGKTNKILISATDYSGNSNTADTSFNISIKHGVKNTLIFDDNGNTISVDTPKATYDWDAADRLVKITQGTNVTEFIYDGLSRRTAQKLNGVLVKRWLWCGTELCEERDVGGSTVIKRFFPQGEEINGKYYFARDHLGSVREMTDAGGNLVTRYDYDPYGRRSRIAGTKYADFGFTGYFVDSISGLNLAIYRAYVARLGRWMSRDPFVENGGINLYAYCEEDPINLIDPFGNWGFGVQGNVSASGGVGFAGSAISHSGGVGYFSGDGNGGGLGTYSSTSAFSSFGSQTVSFPDLSPEEKSIPGYNPNIAVGSSFGISGGIFLTNAKTPCELEQISKTMSLDIGFGINISLSFGLDKKSGTWLFTAGQGMGEGISLNFYGSSNTKTSFW